MREDIRLEDWRIWADGPFQDDFLESIFFCGGDLGGHTAHLSEGTVAGHSNTGAALSGSQIKGTAIDQQRSAGADSVTLSGDRKGSVCYIEKAHRSIIAVFCVDAVFAFVPGEPYGHVSAGLQGGAGQPPLEGLMDVVGKIVVGKQQGRIPAVIQLGPGIGLSIRGQASPGLGHTFGDGQGVGGTGSNGVRSGGKDHFPVFLAGGGVRAIAILAGSVPGIGNIRQQGGQIHLLQNGVIGVGEQEGFAVFG